MIDSSSPQFSGWTAAGGRAPMTRAFVGRVCEIEALTGWLAETAAGNGGSVLVEGEPGIGKSALLTLCAERTRELGYSVFSGIADEVAGQSHLRVLMGMLGEHALIVPDGKTSLISDLASGVPVSAVADRAFELIMALTAQGPVVLVLDDLQFLDEAGLLLWHRLATIAGSRPLFLLAACSRVPVRDGIERIRRGEAGRIAVLELGPLLAADATALVRTLCGKAKNPSPDRIAQAAGNPRYLALLAQTPQDGQEILHRQVRDSLAVLPSRTVQILRAAALMGPEFSLSDLATASGRSVFALAYEVQEVMAFGLLVESGDRLAFRHPLVRESFYQAVPEPVRVGLHRHAAQALTRDHASVTEIAYHVARSPMDEWALEWTVQHASSLRRHSPALAVDLLRQALDRLADHAGDRPTLTAELAGALCDGGKDAQAQVLAHKLAGRGREPVWSLQGNRLLSTVLARSGRREQAMELAARVVEEWEPSQDPAVLGERILLLALIARYGACAGSAAASGDAGNDESDRKDEDRIEGAWAVPRVLALVRQRHDPAERAQALRGAAAVQRARGRSRAALRCLDRAVAEVRNDPGQGAVFATLLHDRVELLRALHLTARMEQDLAELATLAARGIDPERALLARGAHLFRLGQWDEAETQLSGVLGERVPALRAEGIRIIIDIRHSSRSGRALPDTCTTDFAVGGVFLALAKAAVEEWSGRRTQAMSILEVLLEPGWDPFEPHLEFVPTLARLAVGSQRPELASAAVAVATRSARADPTPEALCVADHCTGLVEADPEAMLRAADRFRSAGMRLHLARTLEDAALLFAQAGATDRARTAHREAAELYTTMNAVRDLRRVDARLRSFGVRRGSRAPRRRPTCGWQALSPAEVTVALLVAEGMSNPEIARELVLSPRTVQSHVSHILAKLGGRSRAEIAREVERNRDAGTRL